MRRNRYPVVLAIAAVTVLALAASAGAAPILVPNAGFEDRATFDPLADGTHEYLQWAREYWSHYDTTANGGPARVGNPALSGLATAAEGDYVVRVVADPRPWVADTSAPNGVATLLTETFDPSMTYTLTAQVARYVDDSYWAGYLVQLAAGGTRVNGATYSSSVSGGTVIAEDWNTQPVPLAAGDTDEWATSTVVYTPDPADAGLAGLPLQIRLLTLRKPGDPGGDHGWNDPAQYAPWITYAAFDAVTLDASAGGGPGPPAAAFTSGFEPNEAPPAYVGSSGGVPLTGQDAFYLPSGTDFNVFSYSGNALGLPPNPNGGEQFIAGTGPGSGVYARAERSVDLSTSDQWTVSFDIAPTYVGDPAVDPLNNLGSVSLQPSGASASAIAVARWTDPGTTWQADYLWYDADGTSRTELVGDPSFQGLSLDHWYNWSTTFDLASNQIIEVALTDLTSGTTVTYNPVDRYLQGGAAGGFPIPTAFRFFAGGGVAGNTVAFDNIDIRSIPEPSTFGLAALGLLGLGLVGRWRRK